jgi:hypothetical protein
MQIQQPSRQQKEEFLKLANMCLSCSAPECHEFTPEGVDVCANLPYMDGKPITREMLLKWQDELHPQKAS